MVDNINVKDASGSTVNVPTLAPLITLDNTGGFINPDSFAQTLTYNGDGTLNTISFANGVNTWTQTYSYTSGKVTGISAWVRS